jgi:uncharacterized membrane protein
MPHCTKCGATVADHAAFCASCGAPQGASAAAPSAPSNAAPSAAAVAQPQQMAENVAGLLCYVLGWITGLIFYFVDKRAFVRFHAAQSIVVFGGLHIVYAVLWMFLGIGFFFGGLAGFSLGALLYPLLGIAVFVLWILLMIKAHQGQRFRVPVAADIAEKIFGKF